MLIRARMKTGTGWHDACIVDLSKRGAGLQAATAPKRGDYVEIRRGLHVIVARVVWNRGHRFGVTTQDDLPVANIANDRAPVAKARELDDARDGVERRRLPRSFEEKAEHSRRAGQRMQYVFAGVMGIVAATIAGSEVRQALASPLGEVSAALER